MQVEICNYCEGRGSFLVSEFRDGQTERQCKKCRGTGRLLTRTYKVEIPFNAQRDQIFLDADSNILKEIQKLKTGLK